MENKIQLSEVPLKYPKFPLVPILLAILILLATFSGYLFYQNQQLKKMILSYQIQQAQPSPINTPVATIDPTSDWKTYTNEKYNFEFKYPKGWYLSNNLVDGLRISNQPISKAPTHLDEPQEGTIFVSFEYFSSAFENGTGKTEWVSNNGTPLVSDTIFISQEGNFGYKLIYRKNDPNLYNLIPQANQILSTFKFLENNTQNFECAGPKKISCSSGFACKLITVGKPELGGFCVNEAETNP